MKIHQKFISRHTSGKCHLTLMFPNKLKKLFFLVRKISLTLSWRRLISYRNQSIDLFRKSVDWFLYDIGLRHERVKHPVVFFSNLPMNRKSTQKHLGLLLDEKLNFLEHINEKLKKVTKSFNLLRKLSLTLPRSSLLIIHKSFIRLHLDYDIIYDQPNNSPLF